MRRLAVCAFVVLAVGLVLAPGALASAGVRHAALGTSHAVSAGPALPALGDGATYNISGHVLDFDGNGVPGAEVDWGWWDGSYNYQPGGTNMPQDDSPGTDNTGAFAFTGVSGGHPQGDDLEITYLPPLSDGLDFIDSWNLDFATQNDATPYSYEMRPGHVNVAIANVPTSMATLVPEVKVGEQDVGFATTEVALTGGSGVAGMLPPSFNDVVAYYVGPLQNCTAQAEWLGLSPVTVAAGATAGDTVNLDWNQAQYAHLAGPTWQHSGKPGTKAKMVLKGWPASQQAEFVGYYGGAPGYKDYSASVLSTGPGNTYTTSLQVATNAPVGMYEIDTYRVDSPASFVQLWDYFQVCTVKASASAIRYGKTVRVSGKVWGYGKVTVYSRTKAAGQPATLTAKGWKRVGAYNTKSGKFASGLLRPKRTTWYVVKYNGYDFPAFTSVIKVTVR